MHELADQLLSNLKAIWRHKWYAVVTAWFIALAGWIFVFQLPPRYESQTRVYVNTKSVLRPLLKDLAVQPDLDEMVRMMSQTLISRPNLERVIRMSDLDLGIKTPDDRDKLIANLAKNLSVKSAGLAKENLYTISFVHEDPRTAQRVVESLLSLFVERSLGGKREDADSARNFIDAQLQGYRKKLKESEDAITAFKRRHLGLLPSDGANYFEQVVEAQTALSRAELELKEARNSSDSIKRKLEIASRNRYSLNDDKVGGSIEPETELDVRISALERKLDDLRLTYTEQHPDIVAIVPMIAKLKKEKEAEVALLRKQMEEASKRSTGLPNAAQANDPVLQELTVALTKAEAAVAVMETRVTEYRRRLASLQAVATAVPQVEAEFTELTRDYEVNKARYDELLRRRESAEISGDLEESDAAMGFRVIDPPRVPLTPSGPGIHIMVTAVLLAALAGGIAFAWLVGQIRPAISDERSLRQMTGLPVLGTVVMAWTEGQIKRRRWGFAAFITSFASLLSAYIAIMAALVLTASRV